MALPHVDVDPAAMPAEGWAAAYLPGPSGQLALVASNGIRALPGQPAGYPARTTCFTRPLGRRTSSYTDL
jgi:hypothetical protein